MFRRLGGIVRVAAVAATLATVLNTRAGFAWGCIGHETVALVAEKNLNQHALAEVKRLLSDNPIDANLSRYCQQTGLDEMADAATWADDYRAKHKDTGEWHFLDIPRGVKREHIEQYCVSGDGCVTAALKKQTQILRSSGSDEKRANALRFVIHLIGDIHQPLHCVSNNDRGGNCVPVAYFDIKPELKDPKHAYYSPNLHKVWDEDIVEHEAQSLTPEQFASELDKQFKSKYKSWTKSGSNFENWAWESHMLAEKIAYSKLPHKIPIEAVKTVNSCKDDDCIAERMLKLNEVIGPSYQKVAGNVARSQIAKAGARLAMLLNEIWPEADANEPISH